MGFMWTRAETAEAARESQRSDGRCVTCPACSCEIAVVGTLRLPREFSVLCPNCGHRNVHLADAAHDPRPGVETTRPAHIKFGKKAAFQG